MEEDIKRLYACLEYKDYDAMREYIALILEKYSKEQKEVLLNMVSIIKKGSYRQIPPLLDYFRK